jgi:hypothetical protein
MADCYFHGQSSPGPCPGCAREGGEPPSPTPTVLGRAKAMYASWANSQPDRCSIPPWEKATQGTQMEWTERARQTSPAGKTPMDAKDKRIAYLEKLASIHGPRSLQYDIEHPTDGLNSPDPAEVLRIQRGLAEGEGEARQSAPGCESVDTPEFRILLEHLVAENTRPNYLRALRNVIAHIDARPYATGNSAPHDAPAAKKFKHHDVMNAWAHLRNTNSAIPDEVLDAMRDTLLASHQPAPPEKNGDTDTRDKV